VPAPGGAGAGAPAGLTISIPLSRLVASVVPVKTVDAPVLALACLALAALTAAACYLPARRACRIDPATVLRNE
jgi:ABC-type lipoprotein release transport system permease subunit